MATSTSTSTEPVDRTAAELASLIRAGEVSCEEVTRAFLARIEEREGAVQAWAHLDPEVALAQARACDALAGDRPLRGVPVAVKDNLATFDMPTGCGSPLYAGRRPRRDAACVARLRRAGAVILGKTVMTELAAVLEPAATRNPYDPLRTPGGSSSGSAAAVASAMAPAALGTQTGGSVVRPASYCGVFGFKPTFGAIDRAGLKVISTSLDTIGVFARTVDDVALMLTALGGASAGGESTSPPRIALMRTGRWQALDPAVQTAFDGVAARLSHAGAQIEELELGEGFDALTEAAIVTFQVEIAVRLARERRAQLSDALRALLDAGARTPRAAYDAARACVREWQPRVDHALAHFACALTPSVLGEPPGRETTGDPVFCRTWTLLGTPALSVPFATSSAGLPVGLQLVARRDGDARLLAVAKWAAEHCLDGGCAPVR